MTRTATEVMAGLDVLDRIGLVQAWTKAFGSPPAKGLSQGFVRKALAHEAQCRQFGRHAGRDAPAAPVHGRR